MRPNYLNAKAVLFQIRKLQFELPRRFFFQSMGEKNIRAQEPYRVRLKDGKWTIDGALPPQGFAGGSFHIVILQRDARVLEIGHDV